MKLVPLTQGLFAIVDDRDFDFVMQWNWYAWGVRRNGKGPQRFYAARDQKTATGKKIIRMADAIFEFTYGPIPEGLVIDHVNNLSLDNRIFVDGKPQLEAITMAENTTRRSKLPRSRGPKRRTNGSSTSKENSSVDERDNRHCGGDGCESAESDVKAG